MTDDRQKRIEQRAYEIWDREGRPSGRDAENWQRAEAEIAREEAEASTAKPDEPEEPPVESNEAAVSTEPPAKSTRTATRARTKPQDKPDEHGATSQVRKPASKVKTSEEEAQEKSTRKRRAPIKKQ